MHSRYYDRDAIAKAAQAGQHREIIGGLWDSMGSLQFELLRSHGLVSAHRVLDIGAGSLRLGVKLVNYLDSNNYFGTDLNEALLNIGYEKEIGAECLERKLPRSNLVTNGDFDFSWAREAFDFAIAQSVFTHLPFNHLRVCVERLRPVMKKEGRFFLTFFQVPDSHPTHEAFRHPGGVITYGSSDPYHYRLSDVQHAIKGLSWACRYIGEWHHPRNQMIVELRAV